jgi:hypothetical protein
MSRPVATTKLLKRITKYLGLRTEENDITYNEIREAVSIGCERVAFADGMKFLLNLGVIKVVRRNNQNYYFYNNLVSPEYRKFKKIKDNEILSKIKEESDGNN